MKSWELDRYNEKEGLERKELIYLDEKTKDIEAIARVPKLEKKLKEEMRNKDFEEYKKIAPIALYGSLHKEEEIFFNRSSDSERPEKCK